MQAPSRDTAGRNGRRPEPHQWDRRALSRPWRHGCADRRERLVAERSELEVRADGDRQAEVGEKRLRPPAPRRACATSGHVRRGSTRPHRSSGARPRSMSRRDRTRRNRTPSRSPVASATRARCGRRRVQAARPAAARSHPSRLAHRSLRTLIWAGELHRRRRRPMAGSLGGA